MRGRSVTLCCNSLTAVKSLEATTSTATDPELAGALHEVSNALTVVMGWLDHARTVLPAGPARDALEVAHAHARLGHSVARQAIGAKQNEEESTRSALALSREAVLGIRQEALRRRVTVSVVDHDAPDLLVDSAPAAMQILMNLLLNAVEFSPEGGAVRLELCASAGDMIFAVVDSGPGISHEQVDVLFTEPGSTRSGGAGIGLRHSHALALKHGGELRLATGHGAGARFELKWPVGEAPSRTLNRSAPPLALDGLRVLVLEDDPAVLSLLEFGLGARGATVAAALNDSELLLMLSQGVFDVALIDLSPLGENPNDVLDRLVRTRPDLPLIVISGSVSPDVSAKTISAWVRKPFQIGELSDAIARALGLG